MATALITGGTSGIGADFARSLAARGYDIVLVARTESRLAEMALELPTHVEVIAADLSDRSDVDRVAARIEDPEHPIDILVNNAGFGIHTSLLSRDVSAFDRAFEVMCRAVLVLGGAAGRAMLSRGSGAIINVSSTAGFMTMGAYSAMKAWVTSYSQGLSVELRGTGVTVTALCPGWVRTEFHERARITTTSIPSFLWVDSHKLVEECLRDVERGKVISIPTIRFTTLMWIARHAPQSGVRWISGAISSVRSESSEVGKH
jgi:short-subunit dehydrogenase